MPANVENGVVRLHVELPQLGAGQPRHLVRRVLGASVSTSTVARILLRKQALIAEIEDEKRKARRRIMVSASRTLWGADITLLWVLGFFPVWVLGVVSVMERAFERCGAPERILTDRGTVFRSTAFEAISGRVA